MSNIKKFSSRKEVTEFLKEKGIDISNWSEEKWLKINKGQAEIHMMALAEAIYDAWNESTPKKLEAGEWHIPLCPEFLTYKEGEQIISYKPNPAFPEEILDAVKVATANCARTSYTVVGEEQKSRLSKDDLLLHDKLLESGHMSPFEHCARAMSKIEYISCNSTLLAGKKGQYGWCRNFKGFIQYRHILENEIKRNS